MEMEIHFVTAWTIIYIRALSAEGGMCVFNRKCDEKEQRAAIETIQGNRKYGDCSHRSGKRVRILVAPKLSPDLDCCY